MRLLLFLAGLLAACAPLLHGSAAWAQATEPAIGLATGAEGRVLTRSELLADPSAIDLVVPHDPVYRRTMAYRAVPLWKLLQPLRPGVDDYLQVRATDDFSIGIPVRLTDPEVTREAVAYLAVEPAGVSWPPLPGKPDGSTAGPFYIVWHPAPPGLSSEYWAYHVASLAVVASPYRRWPVLGVPDSVPAADPIRRGLDRYVAICIACHRFDGAGEGDQGPDLARPMNPAEYFTPEALRKLLRDPASVRTWPDRRMPGFDAATLSDADIDAIVAWLAFKARERR